MSCTYVFEPRAAEEYEHAFLWYEERSIVAAENFIIAVQDAITQICTNPTRYRNSYKDFREITLRKYPYNLIYYFDLPKELVIIVSVYHHKRNPKTKYKTKQSE